MGCAQKALRVFMGDNITVSNINHHQLTWYNSLWLWRWLPHRLSKPEDHTQPTYKMTLRRVQIFYWRSLCQPSSNIFRIFKQFPCSVLVINSVILPSDSREIFLDFSCQNSYMYTVGYLARLLANCVLLAMHYYIDGTCILVLLTSSKFGQHQRVMKN